MGFHLRVLLCCFLAIGSKWLHCVVQYWSSSCSLHFITVWKRKLPIVWKVILYLRQEFEVVGVTVENRMWSQSSHVDKNKQRGKQNAICCSSEDTLIMGGVVTWPMNGLLCKISCIVEIYKELNSKTRIIASSVLYFECVPQQLKPNILLI